MPFLYNSAHMPCSCRAQAVPLPCPCSATAVAMSCSCSTHDVPLPCPVHALLMTSPCHSNAVPLPCRALPCPCRAYAVRMTCSCLAHAIACLQGFRMRPCLIHISNAMHTPRSGHAVLLNATAQHARRAKACWLPACVQLFPATTRSSTKFVIRSTPIADDAGGQCETKQRLSWTRERMVAAN
jgi:hypothetical protein